MLTCFSSIFCNIITIKHALSLVYFYLICVCIYELTNVYISANLPTLTRKTYPSLRTLLTMNFKDKL